jgi:hypothetical protein
MGEQERTADFNRFDVFEIASKFPDTADTMLLDTYLTNEEAASSRIIRVYKPFPPHYHPTCDESSTYFAAKGFSGWEALSRPVSSNLAICCSFAKVWCMPFPR